MTTADDQAPIALLPTGEVAIAFASGRKVLTRPTFGQIQPLIRAEARLQDEMAVARDSATAKANELMVKLPEALAILEGGDAPAKITTTENLTLLAEIRDESRAAAEAVEEAVERLMAEWWTTVLDALMSPPADQADWPSSFLDPKMPARMINHWRFVPAGPG